MKCNYEYETLKAIALAFESRRVENKAIELEFGKDFMLELVNLFRLLQTNKKLVAELKAEGLKALGEASEE